MTVAEAILQTLARAGVRTTFGLPGVHNLSFWEATGPGVPEIIGTRHEQTTVYAADGLARAGGGLGVSLTTTGPGVANAVGAFGEAAASGSPVLLISSDTSTRIARAGVVRGGLHESADQGAMFAKLAKALYQPRTAEEAVAAVARGAAERRCSGRVDRSMWACLTTCCASPASPWQLPNRSASRRVTATFARRWS